MTKSTILTILLLQTLIKMKTVDLKNNIHKIVDEIQNEQLLQTVYDFLKVKKSNQSGKYWETLTDNQKNEVLLAFEESEEDYNLINRNDIL